MGGDLKSTIIAGAAISVPALDSVMQSNPLPLNLFFAYPFSPEVSGVAGLYTSPTAHQNGIGIFAKKVIPPQVLTQTQIPSPTQLVQFPQTVDEAHKMSTLSLIKLDRLLKKNATLRVR